ncbi:class I SAM-dependent methyltransferase [Saccharopolyspora rosea]|uniref:Class I SAM-dependent methyltransferase n=1 Tax=Saccharopolyspora rosea TaxID=524884 RepID=A0ABW3FPG8_9PSEU|nr:class I SAM-dependent methyltransferase [Saccharopolyspora rosea]
MNDEYAESAEFIDLLISPFWNDLAPALTEAIKATAPGPVVDVGAGSGCGTAVLADAIPEAEIFAVEPSTSLRTALLARVNADDSLRERVTVLPDKLLAADLPEQLGLVIAMNVIGHFSPTERQAFWELLATRLAPGGQAVLNLQPPSEPVDIPEAVAATRQVGRRRYEVRARARATSDATLTWHMTYRTYQGEDLVDERALNYTWHLVNESALHDELARAGLRPHALEPTDLGMFTITRAPA